MGIFLRNALKKNHQKTYKQYTPIYMDTPFLISLGLLFLVYFWSTKKICSSEQNKHSSTRQCKYFNFRVSKICFELAHYGE